MTNDPKVIQINAFELEMSTTTVELEVIKLAIEAIPMNSKRPNNKPIMNIGITFREMEINSK
jgi:hypothetical protein